MTHIPRAALFLPKPALGTCVFAAVERDTCHVQLSDAQRFNYYPATPMVLLSWIFTGSLHMVSAPFTTQACLGASLPRLVFSGPQQYPCASWSPGMVHALSVAFYPDAMARLLNRPIAAWTNAIVAAEEVLPPALYAAFAEVFDLAPDVAPFSAIQSVLQLWWQGVPRISTAPRLAAWVRSLATRAAFSQAGCSLRQWQRRVKASMGQSCRDLQRWAVVEDAFVHPASASASQDWLTVAHEVGFADQSHLGRAVRRVTGLPPQQLRYQIDHEESFWFYRLIEGHAVSCVQS